MNILKRMAGVIIALACCLFLASCEVNPTRPPIPNTEPSSHDTTIVTVHDTCATVVTERRTFELNNFVLGSPGTKQTLFEGTTLCDRTTLMFIFNQQYVGADSNMPPRQSAWVRDVDGRYPAVPCFWDGTMNTSLQLPNINGTYIDTAYVALDAGVQFPAGTTVTAYILWGTGGSPSNVQLASASPTSPNSTLWHYQGGGTVTKTCERDSCWSDTTRTVVHHP